MKTIISLLLASISSASPVLISPSSLLSGRHQDQQCTAATVDNLLFNVDMPTFQAARDAQDPSCLDWSSDGCSDVPDSVPAIFDFTQSCERHDFGYRNAKEMQRCSEDYKASIDANFEADMKAYCEGNHANEWYNPELDACLGAADVYYEGVRALGGTAWCTN